MGLNTPGSDHNPERRTIFNMIGNLFSSDEEVKEYLEPPLQQHGLKFISAEGPPDETATPFGEADPGLANRQPVGEARKQDTSQMDVIVTVEDQQGERDQIWARLTFVGGQLQKITWQPSLEEFAQGKK